MTMPLKADPFAPGGEFVAGMPSARVCTIALLAVALAPGPSAALPDLLRHGSRDQVANLNKQMAGRLLDFTHNHGCDRRIHSPALNEKRDVYVYLPPGYDGTTQFPAALWLHGFGQDETSFLELVRYFDQAIASGQIPPMVIAAPDGSVTGHIAVFNVGSFYVNSHAGRYADYVVQDVWHGFVRRQFAVRPEREAHILAGASMGGFGAYHLGFKNRAEFAHLIGLFPPLDLAYADCHGRYFGDYDPFCRGVRTVFPRNEIIGRFYGVVLVRSRRITDPLVGRWAPLDERSAFVRTANPADMLDSCDIRPGEFNMFIGYGTKDEFNIDALAQSFVERSGRRGIRPDVFVVPGGKHDFETAALCSSHWSPGPARRSARMPRRPVDRAGSSVVRERSRRPRPRAISSQGRCPRSARGASGLRPDRHGAVEHPDQTRSSGDGSCGSPGCGCRGERSGWCGWTTATKPSRSRSGRSPTYFTPRTRPPWPTNCPARPPRSRSNRSKCCRRSTARRCGRPG